MEYINLPTINAETESGKIEQIRRYLYQLTEELNWHLSTIQSGNKGIAEDAETKDTDADVDILVVNVTEQGQDRRYDKRYSDIRGRLMRNLPVLFALKTDEGRGFTLFSSMACCGEGYFSVLFNNSDEDDYLFMNSYFFYPDGSMGVIRKTIM